MVQSIPASKLARVLPSVLAAGGNPLSLNGIILTDNPRVPIGVVLGFGSGDDVGKYFGFTAIETTLANVYFEGFENKQSAPETVYFAQYNQAAVSAYNRSGSFAGVGLTQLQLLSGVLIIPINGTPVTSANIDLSTATSFSNAAALIQTGLQTAGGIFSGTAKIDNGSAAPGNILTVTVVASGHIQIGGTIVGAGVAGGTTIVNQLTGASGGIGTYTTSGGTQQVASESMTMTSTATVTYDAQLQEFSIHSPTTGDTSTIGFATGSLAIPMKLTSATGAVLSQGAAAAVPAAFMSGITLLTQNWATFMTAFEPVTAVKLAFAAWIQTTNERYAYVAWDSDVTPLAGDAPDSFGAQCKANESDGIYPQWEPATDAGNGRKAAFICGTVASIDFDTPGGRITFAFKGQAGLSADIVDETTYDNLLMNGYNCYAAFATANDRFVNEQPGSTPGAWNWFDSYINQIWLNNNLQLALVGLMTRINFLPYDAEGYNLMRSACLDPIQRALTCGVMNKGVTLSNSQRAQINTAANTLSAADAVVNNGYFLQILDAPPEVRAVRGSPPATLWYADGGSIQHIDLASINVQ